VRSVNGLEGKVALTCSGAPRGATCTVSPSEVMLDGASLAQAKVTVRTTARAMLPPAGSRPAPLEKSPWWIALLALAMLGMLVAKSRRVQEALGARRPERFQGSLVGRRASWAFAMTLLLLLAWTACGGGGGFVSTSGSSGTPAGTYSLTITGTYTASPASTPATVTHSTTVTLTVN
jgi:hypothetical protein